MKIIVNREVICPVCCVSMKDPVIHTAYMIPPMASYRIGEKFLQGEDTKWGFIKCPSCKRVFDVKLKLKDGAIVDFTKLVLAAWTEEANDWKRETVP